MSEFYGVFSNYEIEDVYNFIGTEKIQKRLIELELIPTMGTTLSDFVSKDIKYLGVGVINVFNMILDYFPEDIGLAIYLFNKSKNYNEKNYFSSPKQKKERSEYVEMIKKMILRGEEIEYYQAKLNSPFWVEIHFFYMSLMKLFIKKQDELNLLNFDIEGTYKSEKNKLLRENIILEIKKRRSPRVGNYLLVKSGPKLDTIWFDLVLISNPDEVVYKFKKNSCNYILKLKSNDAIIEKNTDNITNDELTLISTDIEKIAREITINYKNNFNSISDNVALDFTQRLTNGFISYAANFFDENDELIIELIRLNNTKNNIWLSF